MSFWGARAIARVPQPAGRTDGTYPHGLVQVFTIGHTRDEPPKQA
jgi:hypothetical protein